MTESTGTTERDAPAFPVDAVPSPRPGRALVPSSPTPSIPTPSPVPATDEQEHPVTPALAPEAPTVTRGSFVPPRPVSVPGHRAETTDDVVPTDPAEPRPASVARHSVDTSAITLPVFAPEVDPSLPQPPDRLTLDDDVLVRMVERRLDDTATVDLMAVVQAQLQARRVEAARFASWAREMDRVGTDEAAEALERTRLRFTGVIDVVLPIDLDETVSSTPAEASPVDADSSPAVDAPTAPAGDEEASVASPDDVAPDASPVPTSAPVDLPGAEAPSATARPAASAAERTDLVDRAESADRGAASSSSRRPLLLAGLAVAVVVVLAAVVLALVDAGLLASAVLATLAVPVAGGLGGAAALTAVAHRPADVERVASRGPAAVVAGIVVAAVLGYGVLVTTASSLAWQGWLVRLVGFTGMTPAVAVVLAVLVAAVSAFVVAVLATGLRPTSRR